MTPETRDVFIEVTATDLTKAEVVLATLTTMFSEHCAVPFEVEPVEVVDALGVSRGLSAVPCIQPVPTVHPPGTPGVSVVKCHSRHGSCSLSAY